MARFHSRCSACKSRTWVTGIKPGSHVEVHAGSDWQDFTADALHIKAGDMTSIEDKRPAAAMTEVHLCFPQVLRYEHVHAKYTGCTL